MFLNVSAHLFLISILGSRSLLAADPAASKRARPVPAAELVLGDHWTLQTSAKVEAKGEIISTAAFFPKGWHDATVPTRRSLVEGKVQPHADHQRQCRG